MTKVLDAFLFTHEFDLLELRMRALWPVVDKFLLMEGDHNFANKPKEMRFKEQEARFDWAKDKIIHIKHRGPFIDHTGEFDVPGELFVEHQHRQALYNHAMNTQGFSSSDILLISDVDEIPSRGVVEKLKKDPCFPSPLLLQQDFYYYNIKCHRGKRWNGTMAMRFGVGLSGHNHSMANARNARNTLRFVDKDCGWHFAHFYDSEGIREKLKHSSHRAYNSPEYYDPEHLKKCVQENKNYLGKEDGDLPPEPIPEYMMEELRKFPIFMGEEWR